VRPLADVAEALRVASGKSAVLKVQLEL